MIDGELERDLTADDPASMRPAGMCDGRGHVVVYGNSAFVAAFGRGAVGLPAREGLIDLPADAFSLMDAVFVRGRPLARWIHVGPDEWRMTVAPRRDPETLEVYGISFHLRARTDVPIVHGAGTETRDAS